MANRANGRDRGGSNADGAVDAQKMRAGELAAVLSVSQKTVRDWTRRFSLPALRTVGQGYRFDAASVVEWLRARGVSVPHELEALGRDSRRRAARAASPRPARAGAAA